MKRLFTVIAAALLLAPATLRADEGMWLLPLLEKMNADAMRDLGARLTPEQIYSINNSSIKDAIVQFGGGCTGEIVSGSGLLLTNHHCGYGSIQALSTTEHNYLEDGFWAKSRAEEIPVPGLTVRFLQSMTDVTDTLAAGASRQALIQAATKANPGCQVRIVSFYNENVQYLIVSKIYRDVRFVGAPPASAGKFGGDTDNWMWPRHTCDFSCFRVYAGPDNEPADYSPENVPFVPRQFLGVSLKGVQEGDFAMIMGYPGSTQRFQTAAQLEEMLSNNNIRIAARGVRQDILWKAMRADEKVSLQYASKYSGSSNGWKKWIGMKEAFEALQIIPRQKQKEQELEAWIAADPRRTEAYGGAIGTIAADVAKTAAPKQAATLLQESLGRIELVNFAVSMSRSLQMAQAAKASNPGADVNEKEAVDAAIEALRKQYKDYDAAVDRDVAVALIRLPGRQLRRYPRHRGSAFLRRDPAAGQRAGRRPRRTAGRGHRCRHVADARRRNGLPHAPGHRFQGIRRQPAGVEGGRAVLPGRQHDLPLNLRHSKELRAQGRSALQALHDAPRRDGERGSRQLRVPRSRPPQGDL